MYGRRSIYPQTHRLLLNGDIYDNQMFFHVVLPPSSKIKQVLFYKIGDEIQPFDIQFFVNDWKLVKNINGVNVNVLINVNLRVDEMVVIQISQKEVKNLILFYEK